MSAYFSDHRVITDAISDKRDRCLSSLKTTFWYRVEDAEDGLTHAIKATPKVLATLAFVKTPIVLTTAAVCAQGLVMSGGSAIHVAYQNAAHNLQKKTEVRHDVELVIRPKSKPQNDDDDEKEWVVIGEPVEIPEHPNFRREMDLTQSVVPSRVEDGQWVEKWTGKKVLGY